MYAIFNPQTGRVSGLTRVRRVEPGLSLLALEESLYIKLIDNPALYRNYRVDDAQGESPRLVYSKPVTWSLVPMTLLEDATGDEDVVVVVTPNSLELQSSFELYEGFEVFALLDGHFDQVLFHELLYAGRPSQVRLPEDLSRTHIFSSRLAREYKYGVKKCKTESPS